jgi:hypothetical protein
VGSARFRLDISAERFLAYYRGAARNVVATAFDGRRVQFPADALRPFLSREGVRGEFLLEFDANNKLVALRKVADLP